MPRAFVGVGSNVDREANIRAGVRALREEFGDLTLSPVYRSQAVGFAGEDFYNLVAAFGTARAAREVGRALHDIERRFGRDRAAPRFGPRTLDLDLLLYDNLVLRDQGLELPRPDIVAYAFVLRPLADIAGDLRHPVSGQRIADLWGGFDCASQPLQRVELALEG